MIIGTAGHIDHGKSALIEALTGARMDRLKEERRRGITIELNFAALELEDGRLAGIVDVPGHEDFVRTMVAGASGMDLLLLVVAADEGIMPQTLEHLAVAEQLGIPRGIPVVTKADLVEADWLELVELELAERLARSPVRFEPPAVVSSRTGAGIDTLRRRIQHAAEAAPARPATDLFRLPVDRVFSLPGVGTVVTGTTWSGRLAMGDAVRLLPSGHDARVRSLEMHGRQVATVEAGFRTAVGLAGVDRRDIQRGEVLVAAGDPWVPTSLLDIWLQLLPEAPRPLVSRTRVHLHLGTAEVVARAYPRGKLEPGGQGLVRLSLERPVTARGGDRLVLRSYSPVTTIAGGRVLDPAPPRRKVIWPQGLAAAEPAERLAALLERRPPGVEAAALPVLVGVAPREIHGLVDRTGLRRIGDRLVLHRITDELGLVVQQAVARYQREHPSDPGIPLASLRQRLRAPAWLADAVLADRQRDGHLVQDGGVIHLPGFEPTVAGGAGQVDRVVAAVAAAGLMPPTVSELAGATGLSDAGASLRIAAREGRVEAVEQGRYYSREALQEFEAALRALAAEGDITPGRLRERLGLTRKFLIPLLEWSDRRGITTRNGDARRVTAPEGGLSRPG